MISAALCVGAENGFAFRSSGRVVDIGGTPMMFALIETDEPSFDSTVPENRRSVYVRTRAFSCNYRDRAVLAYLAQALRDGGYACFGSEFVADVVAVGDDVTEFSPGDRVIGNCAYPSSESSGVPAGIPTNHASQRYWTVPAAKLVAVSASMRDEVAASFSVGAQTTYSILRKFPPRAGTAVLVTAARSNTSLFAIQALQDCDVNVYALSTTLQAERQLRALGVRKVLSADPSVGLAATANSLHDSAKLIGGFDLVIDPFFDIYLAAVLPTIKPGGVYVTCGLRDGLGDSARSSMGAGPASLYDVMAYAILCNVHMVGNCLGETRDLLQALDDYARGSLCVVIDSLYRGPDVGNFLERTYNCAERFGKVIYSYLPE